MNYYCANKWLYIVHIGYDCILCACLCKFVDVYIYMCTYEIWHIYFGKWFEYLNIMKFIKDFLYENVGGTKYKIRCFRN